MIVNDEVLDSLFSDPDITEIMINSSDSVFVERNGRIHRTDFRFHNDEQLRSFIDRWVCRMGRRVDVSSPVCDVRLPDGSRLNVVLPPVSLGGAVATIRKFSRAIQSCDDLVRLGTVSQRFVPHLQTLVQSRQNIVVAGNSSSGKTTFLNVLSGFIDDHERIITIEDAAELKLQKSHVVRLETRPANAEGRGEVSMKTLVINALRMRPDRLLVGECRGSEVLPMLQALNTGHTGSMTTLHANSARDALSRLEALVLMEARDWPIDVVRQQIASAINSIVYLQRQGWSRVLKEIVSIGFDGQSYVLTSEEVMS